MTAQYILSAFLNRVGLTIAYKCFVRRFHLFLPIYYILTYIVIYSSTLPSPSIQVQMALTCLLDAQFINYAA